MTAVVDCTRNCRIRSDCPYGAPLRINFLGDLHHHLEDLPEDELRRRWLYGPRVAELQ